ncbi:hypothetical protein ABZ726_02000 [Streptomyces hundungensis]|uniref:hypothetical protein n=1 Tax=Streptomyces hundungensis TaxID=1077946 RepID=UPI0033DF882B
MALTSAPLGVLTAGWLVDLAGLRVPMLCFALVYLVLIAVSWGRPGLRAMDEPVDGGTARAAEADEKPVLHTGPDTPNEEVATR